MRRILGGTRILFQLIPYMRPRLVFRHSDRLEDAIARLKLEARGWREVFAYLVTHAGVYHFLDPSSVV